MKDRREIVAIKSFVERELLQRPGVTGVDVDYKIVGGERTNELAIVVWVREKQNVPEQELIPPTIHEVPTDVVEGEFSPISATEPAIIDVMANPINGGVSVGPCALDIYGTLGVVVLYRETYMILSNTHVLAPNLDPEGELITQPGNGRGGNCPDTIVGTFNIGFLGQPSNVDAALAVIQYRFAIRGEILTIGPLSGTDVTFPGDYVAKYGCTTHFTTGRVVSDCMTVKINYPIFGVQIFYDQLRIANDVQGLPFAAPGDSGAILVNEDREAVGLIFGGDVSKGYAVANPIQDVMRAFHMTTFP